jgi:hypothetical protein
MRKQLFIGFCVVLGAIAGVTIFFWQRATQLPTWYTAKPASESTSNLPNPRQVEQPARTTTRQDVTTKINSAVQQASTGAPVKVELDQQEVNNLVTSALDQAAKQSPITKAIEQANTTIQNGRIETGAVINLNRVTAEQLSTQEREALTKVLKTFPAVGDRPFYVGIEGKPRIENGQVVLDESTRIRLGDLRFTLIEVAERLGIPPETLQERIRLQLGDMQVNGVEMVGDRLVIHGHAVN